VLITGSSRGIGRAIAELFADQGANVIVSDLDDELGKKVAADIGGMACYLHLDVGKEDDWIAASEFLKNKFGGLDILVNNAGIAGILETHGPHDPENLDIESWRKVHQTNLDGVALGCKYGIRLMRKSSSASIVNISSRSGLWASPLLLHMHRVKPLFATIQNLLRFTVLKNNTLFDVTLFTRVPYIRRYGT